MKKSPKSQSLHPKKVKNPVKNKEKMMKGSCEEAAYEKLDPKMLKKSLENKEKHEKEATRKLPTNSSK